MTRQQKQWYEMGREARNNQYPRSTCPFGKAHAAIAHAWWQAGYDDADMERVGEIHRRIEEGDFANSPY